ncbi:acyl-homoserine-lactone synthase [Phenylobacterium sp.]|jgi:N-acyl-L-homoserine lactone synthetase|uniref:acyl-homoserine-lactone synthase n=1 Tax=Phenylobacterium sp. TaxID=1871053 RepID=UPI001209DCBC|nr:acyl-homoserine-lactone synthase [Phenylobacterium sp.]THD51689.1 MAG: autoinducer synthase [Phenylobacterium sp.]
MIQLVTAADRSTYPDQLAEMYRERKRVFVDRLRWEVPVVDGEFEIDQFDTEGAVYFLALSADGTQLGSARLLPSTAPHLLSEVFPHLCEHGVPRGEEVWEITRMCTAPGLAEPRAVRQRLMVGMVEFALLNGIRRYTLVSHMAYLSAILAIGWDCAPLGLPQEHDGQLVGAVAINITPDTLALLRRNAGLQGPVLRWDVRDAA